MSNSGKYGLGAVVVAATLAFPVLAQAQDTSDVWHGVLSVVSSDGHVDHEPILVILTQQDGHLTGTAGPSAQEQAPLSHLSMGRELQFDTDPSGSLPLHFDLHRSGGQWSGAAAGQVQGHSVTATVTLTHSAS